MRRKLHHRGKGVSGGRGAGGSAGGPGDSEWRVRAANSPLVAGRASARQTEPLAPRPPLALSLDDAVRAAQRRKRSADDRLQLPDPRRAAAPPPHRPASTPSISTSGEPTMKSVWVADWLRPAASVLVGRDVVEGPGQRVAPGDVGRGVLVEERVVEDDAGLADARGGVDQRDLAEAARAVVDGELGAQGVLAAGGARLDDLAARERAARGPRRSSRAARAASCCGPCPRRARGAGW